MSDPGPAAIRPLVIEDVAELAALRIAQAPFLAPFEPVRPTSFATVSGQAAAIADAVSQRESGTAYPFVIVVDGRIVGQVNLSNVVRGPLRNANLGYWVAREENGRGIATCAVRLVIATAFGRLGLHRVEAGTLLTNAASQRVLAAAGFRQVGIARRYLEIAGAFRDHLLYERVADDVEPQEPGPTPVGVRRARLRDAPSLAALVNAVATEPEQTLLTVGGDSAAAERRRIRSLNHPDDGTVLVAELVGSIVGRLDLVRDDHPHGGHVAEIGIVVEHGHRRAGVGSALLVAACGFAVRTGIARLEALVFPSNEPSLAFFRRHGFAEEGLRHARYARAGELRDLIVLARAV